MTSRTTLDRIVADALARPIPDLTPRRARLHEVPGKADVVVGMRRSGKTTFLQQHMRTLLERGHARPQILYLDLDDERLLPMDAGDLAAIPEALHRRHPEVADEARWYLLDEIQNVDGWERFVRRLVAEPGVRVVLTGSSSRLLSSEVATSLRGRSITTELLPFDFEEVVRHAGLDRPSRWPPAARERTRLASLFDRYLRRGGFPEVQAVEPDTRARILQEYLDVALFRDVVERHDVGNLAALRWLVRRLVGSPGGRFTVNRFYRDLKSQGIAVGKNTLHEYMDHLTEAFLVYELPIDARSERRRMVNPRKIYLADHALAGALSYASTGDVGHKLENMVFHTLRRGGGRIGYYETESGREVDFVLRPDEGAPRLVQVAAELDDPDTRRHELRSLAEAMAEQQTTSAELVTLSTEETIDTDQGRIDVVPAWHWLLEAAEAPSA